MSDDPQTGDRPPPESPGVKLSVRTALPDVTAAATPGPGQSPPFLAAGVRPLPEYELLSPLGRGSFGEVWKASGPGGFPVALKFIRLGDEAGQVELRALELMKGIRHAHLLPMFGAWQRDDLLIIAMELADRTLYQRWKEAHAGGLPGIPAPELLEYMREAAKGLDYLNDHCHPVSTGRMVGIQHKDVKPQNLLLVGGTVKVGDFGLARLLERTVTAASGSMTPAYTAPEFLRGQATRWSDQYCLAVTYCQLRGGRLPFEGGTPEVLAGHAMYAPDLGMVPATEQPAVARALAKEPDQRWPSCREFVRALAATADPGRITFSLPSGSQPPAPRLPLAELPPAPARFRPGKYAVVAAGVLVLLAAAAVAVWAWSGRPWAGGRQAEAAVLPPSTPAVPATVPEPPRPQPTEREAGPSPAATVHEAPRTNGTPAPPKPAPPPPALHLGPPPHLVVEAGKSTTVAVHARRENCSGPIRLELEGLPPKLHAQPARMEAGQDVANLEVQADEAAEAGAAVARLRAWLGNTEAQEDVQLVVRLAPGLELFPPPALTLEAGEARTVVVRLQRRRVTGPVELRLENLPPGVVCRPTTVAPGAAAARLELEASPEALPAPGSGRLAGEIKGAARAEASFPVKVGPERKFKECLAEANAAVQAAPRDPVAWLNRGHTYREAGLSDKARSDYSQAIRLDPEYAPAYYYRGRVYLDKQDARSFDHAQEDFDEAIRLDPKFAPAYFQRGLLCEARGDHERAVAEYGRALEIDPTFAAAYLQRADAWQAMKLYDRAVEDYDRALRIDGNSATAHFHRGLAYHLLKHDDQAVTDYSEALRLGPKLAVVYKDRGDAWRARKDAAKALADYGEAIRLDSGFAAAYAARGRLYEEQGDNDRARADLEKARSLGGPTD